jgi:hypothetical protein
MRGRVTWPNLVNHHITGHLVFVLVSTEWVTMCPAIDNSASCEIHAVICFLHAKNTDAVEIHHELCAVYGQNVMSEGTVRRCCRMFKDGRANKRSWWRAKWLAICSEWWSCSKCWPKNMNIWKTVIHNFRTFTWICTNVLYEIITVKLVYHKFCATCVPKMLTGVHKMQRMVSALTFLEWYHKEYDEFLNHIIWVTGDKTWLLSVNVETRELSKQWMHTHPPNKPKKFKQTLSAKNLMWAVFRDRKGVPMVEFMQQGTTMSQVYCEMPKKKNCVEPFRTKGMECWHTV